MRWDARPHRSQAAVDSTAELRDTIGLVKRDARWPVRTGNTTHVQRKTPSLGAGWGEAQSRGPGGEGREQGWAGVQVGSCRWIRDRCPTCPALAAHGGGLVTRHLVV